MSSGLTMKQNWEWIDPPELKEVCRHHGVKAFACASFAISGMNKEVFKKGVQQSQILGMFRNEIHRHWEAGKNIILGNEEIDRITITSTDKAFFKDQLFSLLPDGYEQYTEIVTVYRAPRIKHLISLCKENFREVEHWTLQQCISHLRANAHAIIDSLSLTKTFLDMGLQVTMLDMSDLNFEMYQIMACDLMKEPCDSNKIPLYLNRIEHEKIERGEQSIIQSFTKKANVRMIDTEKMNVPQDVLDKIDNMLQAYDCGFKSIEHHPNLTVLYNSVYKENMAQCPGLASNMPTTMSREDLYEEMKALALS